MNKKIVTAASALFLSLPIYALDYSDMITESKDIVDGASQSIAPFMVMLFVWVPVIVFLVAVGISFWMYSKKEDERKNPSTAFMWGAVISIACYFIFYVTFSFILFKMTDSADAYTNMVTNYFSTMFADYI
ncbi:MAG TPA: hypothetical protein EYG73_10665 [Arcobacter sp.]|nr:hypothetical protein [Arcobacter sp.]